MVFSQWRCFLLGSLSGSEWYPPIFHLGIFASSRHLLSCRTSLSGIDANSFKPESMYAIMTRRFPIRYFLEYGGGLSLESESSKISGTLLSILAYFNNAVILMVSIFPLISYCSSFFRQARQLQYLLIF